MGLFLPTLNGGSLVPCPEPSPARVHDVEKDNQTTEPAAALCAVVEDYPCMQIYGGSLGCGLNRDGNQTGCMRSVYHFTCDYEGERRFAELDLSYSFPPLRRCSMRTLVLVSLTALAALPTVANAQSSADGALREWEVEWGGRVRDPYVAPDGRVWFVGQQGNYIANFDPRTSEFSRYEIEDGTNPHNLIVDEEGIVWFAGNRNGRIGRLDPTTGRIRTIMTGEARDPHTLVLDGRGNIWFTSQGSNRVGRLRMASEQVDLITPNDTPSNPYGIVIDSEGHPWVALFRTNSVARIDPETLEVTKFEEATTDSRSRRISVTMDGMVWYVDQPRGFIGRIDPGSGEVREWATPGGSESAPYALTKDGQDRLWFSETGPEKRLIGFDPRSEDFFSVNEVSGTIRHMMYNEETGAMWFGTDANNLGRIIID
jgi:virginiamycin B lyase